jgi:hypothetical protein
MKKFSEADSPSISVSAKVSSWRMGKAGVTRRRCVAIWATRSACDLDGRPARMSSLARGTAWTLSAAKMSGANTCTTTLSHAPLAPQ